MRKWALGIIIFLSVTLTTGISNVSAKDLPDLTDYQNLYTTINNDNLMCMYYSSSNYDTIYCYSGHFTPYLGKSSSIVNDYNPNGYYLSSWRWVGQNNNNYQSTGKFHWDKTNNSWVTDCYTGLNNCGYSFSANVIGSNSYISAFLTSNSNITYPVYGSNYIQVTEYGASVDNPYIFPPAISNPFTISYEQGEVLMAGSQNSANLVTMNLTSTNVSPVDYIFTYSYRINENELPTNYTFMPTCSTLVDSNEDIQYTCYYNIPMYYNTDIHFSIIEKESITEIYSYDLTAYLSILPNTSYYNIYAINGYKYVNISNINDGTFALQNDLVNNVAIAGHIPLYPTKIYVYDYSNNTKTELETTNYFISKTTSNGYTYYNFDFNGDTNKFITIELLYPDLYDNQNYKYIYAPKLAYVHLSDNITCNNNDDETCQDLQSRPQNQQSYIDSNGDTQYIDNSIIYTDNTNFYNTSNDILSQVIGFMSGIGTIFTLFVNGLNPPILATLCCIFIFSLIAIIYTLFKH